MLHKKTKKPNHMGTPIKSYLEPGKPIVLEDLNEEGVQRKPHSKFKVDLKQGNIVV